MPRFVCFDLAQGGQLAVNPSAVTWARPASDVEKADGRYFRFHVAGHCQILLTPDLEESNDFRVRVPFEVAEEEQREREWSDWFAARGL